MIKSVYMQPPFNTLPAVTELIKLYKQGYSTPQLARYFDTNKGNCLKCLRLHNVPIRSSYGKQTRIKDYEFAKKRYTDKFEKPLTRTLQPLSFEKGKYDEKFDEPVCEGKNYDDLLKQYNIPKPKPSSYEGGFSKMHRYDLRRVGINKVDFIRKKPL